MLFTYAVCPALMSWAAFFATRAYTSFRAALLVGCVAAVGFQFWVTQYGSDSYILSILLGFVLLGLRGRWERQRAWHENGGHPFVELSPVSLFLVCAVAGFAAYTFRFTLIFSLAFFIPSRPLYFVTEWVRTIVRPPASECFHAFFLAGA